MPMSVDQMEILGLSPEQNDDGGDNHQEEDEQDNQEDENLDDQDGGDGQDDQGDSSQGDDGDDEVAELKQTVASMQGQMQQLIQIMLANQNPASRPAPQEPPKKTYKTPEMDWSDVPEELRPVVKAISDKLIPAVVQQIDTRIEGLEGKVGELGSNAEMKAAKDSLSEAASKHPDFWNYRDVMGQLAKKNPGITDAESLYFMAKGMTSVVAPRKQGNNNKPGAFKQGQRRVPGGNEKPGSSRVQTRKEPETVMEAAMMAYKDNKGLQARLAKNYE
jgi:hypothetical protein